MRFRFPLASFLLAPALAAEAQAPAVQGYVTETWSAREANRCVPDVDAALDALGDRGDLLGFRVRDGQPLNRLFAHWQGVQRLAADGGRWLALSRSGAPVGFALVELGSRNRSGLAFGSNRDRGLPPETDGLVYEVPAPEGFRHGGGIQVLGHVLAVPYEEDDRSLVVFYDVSSPRAPRILYTFDHGALPPPHQAGHASLTGLARLADGRILLVAGERSSKVLEFHVSTEPEFTDPGFAFHELAVVRGVVEGGFQAVNLLTQCDGTLFLVGTHNTGLPPPSLGRDWMRWYRLDDVGEAPVLTLVGSRRLFCESCNFGAGAGLYVDPEGRPLLYAVGWSDGGPGRSTALEEFRSPAAVAAVGDGTREP